MKAFLKRNYIFAVVMAVVAALSQSLVGDSVSTAHAQAAGISGNWYSTIFASATRATPASTQTINSADLLNPQWRGAHFIINVTTASSGSFIPHIQGRDPVSGSYYDLLAGASVSATGVTVLKVYPGITASTNVAVSDILPRVFRVQLTTTSPASLGFSIGAQLEQ